MGSYSTDPLSIRSLLANVKDSGLPGSDLYCRASLQAQQILQLIDAEHEAPTFKPRAFIRLGTGRPSYAPMPYLSKPCATPTHLKLHRRHNRLSCLTERVYKAEVDLGTQANINITQQAGSAG